jgi:hypothetical protein
MKEGKLIFQLFFWLASGGLGEILHSYTDTNSHSKAVDEKTPR